MPNSSANRGKKFEEMVEEANEKYFQEGKALIHKVPSEWLPLRNKEGKIKSAKITRKAAVDFMGVTPEGPLAFDAKSTKKERWEFKNLAQEQLEFLLNHRRICPTGRQFILLAFMPLEVCYLIDIAFMKDRWEQWKQGGKASFHCEDLKGSPCVALGPPPDYLKKL